MSVNLFGILSCEMEHGRFVSNFKEVGLLWFPRKYPHDQSDKAISRRKPDNGIKTLEQVMSLEISI